MIPDTCDIMKLFKVIIKDIPTKSYSDLFRQSHFRTITVLIKNHYMSILRVIVVDIRTNQYYNYCQYERSVPLWLLRFNFQYQDRQLMLLVETLLRQFIGKCKLSLNKILKTWTQATWQWMFISILRTMSFCTPFMIKIISVSMSDFKTLQFQKNHGSCQSIPQKQMSQINSNICVINNQGQRK